MASELRVDRIIPVNGVPTGGGGGIIQIVQGTYSIQDNTTSTTFVDTGLTTSITLTSSSSKVLVASSMPSWITEEPGTDATGYYALTYGVDNTVLQEMPIGTHTGNGTRADNWGSTSFDYLHSPGIAGSALTYKIRMKSGSSGWTIYSCQGNRLASLILMEVSG